MKTLLLVIDRVLVVVAIGALILMMGITTVSVIGRKWFNSPIPDDLVMSEMLMVFVVFLPLSYVQLHREHVFVTLFTDWMPRAAQLALETLGLLVGFAIFGVLTAATFTDFYGAWSVGAYVDGPLELPEWPSRFVVFLGVLVFSVRLFVDLIAAIVSLRRPRGWGPE
ncbi:MAG: TRAP transporter small permease [Candidatus Methylomirabilia bacterium]